MRKAKTKKAVSLVLTLMFVLSIFAVFPAQEAEASTTYKTLPVRNIEPGEATENVNTVTVVVDEDVMAPRHAGRTFRLDMTLPAGFGSVLSLEPGQNVDTIVPNTLTGRAFQFEVTVAGGEVEDALMANIEVDVLIEVGGMTLFDVTVHDTDVEGVTQFSVDDSENAALGDRVTVNTFEDTFTLYLKDAAGVTLETAESSRCHL